MSQHARQPTLLRMVMDPSTPTTPPKFSSTTSTPQDTDANRTELEPTPLLLALDMQAERKRLRSRKDSVFTGVVEGSEDAEKDEATVKREYYPEIAELVKRLYATFIPLSSRRILSHPSRTHPTSKQSTQ